MERRYRTLVTLFLIFLVSTNDSHGFKLDRSLLWERSLLRKHQSSSLQAKEFHRQVKLHFGFHDYSPAPAFLQLDAETRHHVYHDFRPFFMEVTAQANAHAELHIAEVMQSSAAGQRLVRHLLQAESGTGNNNGTVTDDSLLVDENAMPQLAKDLSDSVPDAELQKLKEARDAACKDYIDNTLPGGLNANKLNAAPGKEKEACKAAEAKYQAKANVKNTSSKIMAIVQWMKNGMRKLIPTLYITGTTGNVFPMIFGAEDVWDFITGENVAFYYRGGFIFGTSMFGMSISKYFGLGWKGSTTWTNLADAYSGYFQCVDVNGGFLFLSGAFSACWSAGPWKKDAPEEKQPAVDEEVKKEGGAMAKLKNFLQGIVQKPDFGAVLTVAVSVGVGLSMGAFLPTVGGDFMQTCYETMHQDPLKKLDDKDDGLMAKAKKKLSKLLKTLAEMDAAGNPVCAIPKKWTDKDREEGYKAFTKAINSRFSIFNPFSWFPTLVRRTLAYANRYRSFFYEADSKPHKDPGVEDYVKWATWQAMKAQSDIKCSDTNVPRCPPPLSFLDQLKKIVQGAKDFFSSDDDATTKGEQLELLAQANAAIRLKKSPLALNEPNSPKSLGDWQKTAIDLANAMDDWVAEKVGHAKVKEHIFFPKPVYVPGKGKCDAKSKMEAQPMSVSSSKDVHKDGKATVTVITDKGVIKTDDLSYDDEHYEKCRSRYAALQYVLVGLMMVRFRSQIPATLPQSAKDLENLATLDKALSNKVPEIVAQMYANFNYDCLNDQVKTSRKRFASYFGVIMTMVFEKDMGERFAKRMKAAGKELPKTDGGPTQKELEKLIENIELNYRYTHQVMDDTWLQNAKLIYNDPETKVPTVHRKAVVCLLGAYPETAQKECLQLALTLTQSIIDRKAAHKTAESML